MSTERTPMSDRELWQSLATDRSVAPAAVSDMDFAAWLEGRLPEATAARIEAAVASDPAMRQAALELADVLGMPLPAPPPRMTVRAQALVGFEAERQAPRKSWLAGLFPAFGQGFALQRGAMAGMRRWSWRLSASCWAVDSARPMPRANTPPPRRRPSPSPLAATRPTT